jgi:hypothetical protein
MNLRYASITLALLATTLVAAQPTLTTANHVPVVGQTVALWTGTNYTWEGPSGAGVTYNYWDLFPSASGNRNFYYAPPNGVPAAGYATTDGGSDSTFWSVSADGLSSVGEKQPLTGRVSYPQPLLELPLPLSFGNSWNDAVTVNYVAQAVIPVVRLATVSGTADAYGQLTLPNANTVEVLRVKVRRDIRDESSVINVRRIINFSSFYTASNTHPVMKLQIDSLQLGTGDWTITRSVELTGAGAFVGVDEYSSAEAYFNAYPNPAGDAVTIQLNGPASQVELLDAKGAIVRTLNGTRDQVRMDLHGLEAGHYLIRAFLDGKVLETRPLVVE